MSAKKPSGRQKLSKTVERLMQEMYTAYSTAGKELSKDQLNERMQESLDIILPVYMQKELCVACGLPKLPEDDDRDDNNEQES